MNKKNNQQDDIVILTANAVKKHFEDGNKKAVHILNGIHFSCKQGESVAIMGTSGSGKSTLLHCLAGLDVINAGSIDLLGYEIHALNEAKRCSLRTHHVGFVYQFHHLLPEFNTVENVMMPLWLQKKSSRQAKKKAMELLDLVGLKQHALQSVLTLSGGERQRVAIARAMVTKPDIIFADEPTGNLDDGSSAVVMDMLLDLKNQFQTSLVLVTHSKDVARKLDRVVEIKNGLIHTV